MTTNPEIPLPGFGGIPFELLEKELPQSLGFQDVAFLQNKNICKSRLDADIKSEAIRGVTLKVPLIAANMSSVTNVEFCVKLAELGAMGILHRDNTAYPTGYYDAAKKLADEIENSAASIGIKDSDWQLVKILIQAGIQIIVIDVAHGYCDAVIDLAKRIKEYSPKTKVVVGNTINPRMMEEVDKWADAVKIGIGGGLGCSTANVTGCTEKMFSVVTKFKYISQKLGLPVISDGGIREGSDFCVAGNTRILTSNLEWVEASKIKANDELIGFEEYPQFNAKANRNYHRKFHTTKVLYNSQQKLPCLRITTDKGAVIISKDHKWLIQDRRSNPFIWKKSNELKIGDKIIYFGQPWTTNTSYEAAYLAGFMDGEGCLCVVKSSDYGHSINTSWTQAEGPLAESIITLSRSCGINFTIHRRKKSNNPNHQKQCEGHITNLYDVCHYLGTIRPQRLLAKCSKIWDARLSVVNTDRATILNIEDVGIYDTYSVSTESGTYIAEGMLSHNCKAILGGANSVMAGSIFARCPESAAEELIIDNQRVKKYFGMSSKHAQDQWKGGLKPGTSPEGKIVYLPLGESVEFVINRYAGALRSGITYAGGNDIKSAREKVQFIRI